MEGQFGYILLTPIRVRFFFPPHLVQISKAKHQSISSKVARCDFAFTFEFVSC